MHDHRYSASLVWNGNRGNGTATYAEYGRDYRIAFEGKPPIDGSADPAFRGDDAVGPCNLPTVCVFDIYVTTRTKSKTEQVGGSRQEHLEVRHFETRVGDRHRRAPQFFFPEVACRTPAGIELIARDAVRS